jgi:putative transferase (TIGR04331 family)
MNDKYLLFSEHLLGKVESNDNNTYLVGTAFYFKNFSELKNIKKENYFCLSFEKEELNNHFSYLSKLYERLIEELSEQLNTINKINYPIKYWRILLGPWVQYFLQATFMRWSLIEKISENGRYNCDLIDLNSAEIIPLDLVEFSDLIVDEKWNSFIYSEIIKLKKKNFNILSISKIKFQQDKKFVKYTNRGFLFKILSKIFNYFKNYNKYVFVDNYVGVKNEIITQFKLLNIPYVYQQEITKPKKNIFSRELKIKIKSNNDYEVFLQNIINFCLPKCFYEYFKYYRSKALEEFPKNSKATISSVQHQMDEFYKFWIGENKYLKKDFKLYICQHGGYLGMGIFNFNTYTDIENSDSYLSWGWSDKNYKVKPLGFLINYKKKEIKDKKNVSLVMYSVPEYTRNMMPNLLQDKNIFLYEQQMKLIESLATDLKQNLIVRPPVWYKEFYIKEIKNQFPNVRIDTSEFAMNFYEESKILLTTCNGTVLLQSLYLNIPTIGIWPKSDMMLNDDAKKYFGPLQANDVILHDYDKASKLIKSIYVDPLKWWNENSRKESVDVFKNKYCLTKNKTIFQDFFIKEFN